jgi:hypothetical protein
MLYQDVERFFTFAEITPSNRAAQENLATEIVPIGIEEKAI